MREKPLKFAVKNVGWQGEHAPFHIEGRGALSENELQEQLVAGVPWHEGASGVLLQSFAHSHPWFADYQLGVLNVVRILSFVPDEGPPILQAAIPFSGRVVQPVNDWSNGAVSIHVDLATRIGFGSKPRS